jgi:glutamate synthase domain-containing protein 2
MLWLAVVAGVLLLVVLVLAVQDLTQRTHAIRRNFPVVGRFRYLLEKIGPELRQYIVAGDNEERPFNRDERRWVYASAKRENNYFGFGTDDAIETTPGYLIVKHSTLGCSTPASSPGAGMEADLPCAKVLGAPAAAGTPFRPASVVNISGMSFGALSGAAIEALNRGAASPAACTTPARAAVASPPQGRRPGLPAGHGVLRRARRPGRFELSRLKDLVQSAPVRRWRSSSARAPSPAWAGTCPGAKVSARSRHRGHPEGKDCISPSRHAEFSDVDGFLDFVELLADETGLPVTVKSAVGELRFWEELADRMASGTRGVDGITIDGGEGGTGAAPLVFTDHVALPFRTAFPRVYRSSPSGAARADRLGRSAKVGLPDRGLLAMAMGADLLHAAREPMLSIGCIQAKKCHTDHCPTGVATQSAWLSHGLDPTLKSSAARTTSRRCAATCSRWRRPPATTTPRCSPPTTWRC